MCLDGRCMALSIADSPRLLVVVAVDYGTSESPLRCITR